MTGRRSAALSSETAGGRITRAWDGQRLCAEVSVHHGACARGIRSSAPSRLIAGTWRGFDGASRSRRPSQGDSRSGLFGGWVDPRSGKGSGDGPAGALISGPVVLGPARLVEDDARLSGELGPFGGLGPVVPGFKYPGGDCDLVTGPVGLRAPSSPAAGLVPSLRSRTASISRA